ncbi:MAG TPA: aminopeptidase N [Micromonosporaceae bacterium]|nr:aminopeptidase N [Micromonosporaceae bacterium]
MPSLTRDEAVERASLITVDSYALDLDLARGAETFGSVSTITFTCREPGAATFVEVRPRELRSATLNGRSLDTGTLAGGRLPLPDLAADNVLVVDAEMGYTNTGQGMHRFVDPADGLVYVYASSFLDEAPGIFACFDQPDLKAPYRVTVAADPEWTVAGNGAATLESPGHWRLAGTPPLASYFVTLIAGAYHEVRDEHDGVPLRLYARRSLATHLDHQAPEILAVTRACLDRYHELFAVRYPFGTYGQAFVPELTVGAMENPGCVTFSDDFVFTSAVTEAQREDRAMVIAHEMAHMWFGDLVTMRWWDDLWLNESFAEYLGVRVTAEVTPFRDVWTSFALARKAWGYEADQRPSTHPVAGEVADATAGLLNFDGISYAKGASVLRQLAAWLGDEAFLAGLRAHVQGNAYRNATLADLLAAMAGASGRDLDTWSRAWLRTPGVSTLRPVVRVDGDGGYASVEVEQVADVQRPHRVSVGCYALEDSGGVRRTASVGVDVQAGRTPIKDLDGRAAGDLLLVNDGDLTYAKIRLDPAAQRRLPALLPAVPDPLTRALLWGAAWDMTRDAEVPAGWFVDLCAAALPTETNVAIMADVLGYVRDFAVDRYLPPGERDGARRDLAAACRTAMDRAGGAYGRLLAAARGLVSCARPEDAGWMRDWLAVPSGAPAGLVLDADLRWLVVRQLAALGECGADEIDAEYARDRTASGGERAARARAARPDAAAKAATWSMLIEDGSVSHRILFAAAVGFWRPGQEHVTGPYVDRYVTDMPVMASRRPSQVVERIATLAFPAYAVDAASLAKLTRMRDDGALVPELTRAIVDEADELARSVAARALATGSPRADQAVRVMGELDT